MRRGHLTQTAIVALRGRGSATRGVSFGGVLHFFELGHGVFSLITTARCRYPISSAVLHSCD